MLENYEGEYETMIENAKIDEKTYGKYSVQHIASLKAIKRVEERNNGCILEFWKKLERM